MPDNDNVTVLVMSRPRPLPPVMVLNEIETVPLSAPEDCGANVTFPLTLCPPARVTGYVKPLKVKPVPDSEVRVIVTLVQPEFVRVTGFV